MSNLPAYINRMLTGLAGHHAQKVGLGRFLWFLLQAEVAAYHGEQ